jgi:hypothetical protein
MLWLPTAATAANFADTLRTTVRGYVNDPQFGGLATVADRQADNYVKLIQGALRNSRGLKIDVILDKHEYLSRNGVQAERDVAQSQDLVYSILDSRHYDVIGVEGGDEEALSVDAMFASAVRMSQEQLGYVDSTILRRNLAMVVASNGVLRYLADHPRPAVGVEVIDLTALHNAVLDELENGPRGQGPEADQLNTLNLTLSRARSFVAVAKVINKLRAVKGTHGCLVIGLYHGNDLRQILTKYGLLGEVINTTQSAQ